MASYVLLKQLQNGSEKSVCVGPDSLFLPRFVTNSLGLCPDQLAYHMQTRQYVARSDRFLKYRGNELNRSKFFLVEGGNSSDEELDKCCKHDVAPPELETYRYTGWQYGSMLHYRPIKSDVVLESLTEKASKVMGMEDNPFNHLIGTAYWDGSDYIGFHNDKTVSLEPDVPILIISFGCDREFVVRRTSDETEIFRKPFRCGDAFILGWKTNDEYQHSIVSVKDEKILDPKRKIGARFSLVFRRAKEIITVEEIKKHLKKAEKERKRKLEKETMLQSEHNNMKVKK